MRSLKGENINVFFHATSHHIRLTHIRTQFEALLLLADERTLCAHMSLSAMGLGIGVADAAAATYLVFTRTMRCENGKNALYKSPWVPLLYTFLVVWWMVPGEVVLVEGRIARIHLKCNVVE